MADPSVFLMQWLTLVAVFSLAVVSPGPDFVMAVRNSVLHSRRAGLFTALGFGCGVLIHVTYTVLGIAALIAQSILVFNILKFAGAAYLIWIGLQAIRSKGMHDLDIKDATQPPAALLSDTAAFRSGFLTNVLNPKATLFFLAVFSQIIRSDTPQIWQAIYGLTCAVMVTAWFSMVAVVLTQQHIRARFMKAAQWIDRICGVLLIGLGIKVALASRT